MRICEIYLIFKVYDIFIFRNHKHDSSQVLRYTTSTTTCDFGDDRGRRGSLAPLKTIVRSQTLLTSTPAIYGGIRSIGWTIREDSIHSTQLPTHFFTGLKSMCRNACLLSPILRFWRDSEWRTSLQSAGFKITSTSLVIPLFMIP